MTTAPSSTAPLGRVATLGVPLAVGLAGALLVVAFPSLVKVLVLLGAVLAALLIAVDLEAGLFVLVFTCYAHLSQVLIDHHRLPSVLDPLVALLLGLTAFKVAMKGIDFVPVVRAALPILGYGLAGLATLLVAVHPDATRKSLAGFVNDAVVALLIVALLQTRRALRGAVWALLAAGLLLGSTSVHQELTKDYADPYWGFALAAKHNISGSLSDYRIGGPVADPNFYALFLVPLAPLALDRFNSERRKRLRVLALAAFGVVCLSVVFTYSRGGFLALAATTAVMMVRRPPKLRVLVFVAIVAVPVLSLVPGRYSARLGTIPDVLRFRSSDPHGIRDSGMRGRVSEMMVAALMFREHPLLGVGVNNFPYLYQEYARRIGPDSRLEYREPHSRYLEVAAEMGLAGIVAYGALLVALFLAMRAGEAGLKASGDLDGAGMVRAFEVGLAGFLIGSLFLHGAFPRFFWVLAGIALATRRVGEAAASGGRPPEATAGPR